MEWVQIQRVLARDTTVYVYDRGGLGWSDPAPRRSMSGLADELDGLLGAAGVPLPYILVGHSIGGLVARMYAGHHREKMAGLLLVDSSHEDQLRRLGQLDWHATAVGLRLRAVRRMLKPLGLLRLATDLGITDRLQREAARECPPDLVDAGRAFALSSAQRRAVVGEFFAFAGCPAEFRADTKSLGRLPLTVITAGPEDRPNWYPAWRELQADLTHLSEHAEQVTAEHTGHHVHLDDPDLVIRTIRDFVEQLRGSRQAV